MNILGNKRIVADVPITRSNEAFNEYELEDGSVLRVKPVATAILRIEGEFTAEGKPVYLVILSPNIYVVTSQITSDAPALLTEKPV